MRLLLIAAPRLAHQAFPECLGYLHNLFEPLACADLAMVQAG